MIFIKKLNRMLSKNKEYFITFVLFFCEYCEQYVERPIVYKNYKSCGCKKKEFIGNSKNGNKHGGYGTKLYNKWLVMKRRCSPKDSENKLNYFDRDILVCQEWTDKENGFINFRDCALWNGYKEDLTIDRINNYRGYSPENCRFLTSKENSRYKRTTKLTVRIAEEIIKKYNIDKYSMRSLAKEYNVARTTISNVINGKTWRNI